MPYKNRLTSRFAGAISQVDELLKVHQYLQVVPAKSVADHLLRASLTMIVSALDTLVHELIINAIIFELKEGQSAFNITGITIDISVIATPSGDNQLRIIESNLRRQYAKQSFQSSRQIEGALASVGIKKIWKKLEPRFNQTPEDIKTRLDLIVRRRNQIVHEGDLDQLHNLHEIERSDIENACEFCKLLASGIIDEFKNMTNAV